MKLTDKQIKHVAALARLGLSRNEIEKFGGELSSILDYVEKLNEVKTDGIEPTAQVTGLINVMRDDKVVLSNENDGLADSKALLACSPLEIENDQIKVKKVF